MEGILYICCLVSKLYCIELCIDYSVVLFLYRWSVQPAVWSCFNESRGVFIVVFM